MTDESLEKPISDRLLNVADGFLNVEPINPAQLYASRKEGDKRPNRAKVGTRGNAVKSAAPRTGANQESSKKIRARIKDTEKQEGLRALNMLKATIDKVAPHEHGSPEERSKPPKKQQSAQGQESLF